MTDEKKDRGAYGAGTDAGGRRRPRAAALLIVVWKTAHGFGKVKCFTDTVFGKSLASVRSNSGTPRASRSWIRTASNAAAARASAETSSRR